MTVKSIFAKILSEDNIKELTKTTSVDDPKPETKYFYKDTKVSSDLSDKNIVKVTIKEVNLDED